MKTRSALLVGVLCLAGCDDAPATPDAASRDAAVDAVTDTPVPHTRDIHYVDPPRGVLAEPGVRREAIYVDAPAPPPNPTTSTATPAEYNRVQVIRYRIDSATPRDPRAVIVAMPGFLGGAGSFDPIARSLVKRGAAAMTPVEVWVIDRRSNLLEDLRAMSMADAMRDPEIAAGYYLRGDVTIDGQAFPGFRAAGDPALAYMSEWGIATAVNDLRAVVDHVPSSRTHVVLLGHSLGASVVEAYAAWDFNGTPGYRTIAGMALVEGVTSGSTVTEAEYLTAGVAGPGGFGSTSASRLRMAGPYFVALPILGVQALVVSEVLARRAVIAPDAIVQDDARDALFRILLGVTDVPPMTNAAALGFGFDDASCPLAFARMSMGAPSGGALRMSVNPFAAGEMVTGPASATDTYRWTDAPMTTPREFTPVANGAAAWATTPTNFSEWYFPTRLSLDVSALGDLNLATGSWQVREGIRATHGRDVDVPVLGVAAGLLGRATAFDPVRTRIAPAVGADLPGAGATRTVAAGFQAVHVPRMTHLDPITGADGNPDNPVPELVFTFATDATTGTTAPNL